MLRLVWSVSGDAPGVLAARAGSPIGRPACDTDPCVHASGSFGSRLYARSFSLQAASLNKKSRWVIRFFFTLFFLFVKEKNPNPTWLPCCCESSATVAVVAGQGLLPQGSASCPVPGRRRSAASSALHHCSPKLCKVAALLPCRDLYLKIVLVIASK